MLNQPPAKAAMHSMAILSPNEFVSASTSSPRKRGKVAAIPPLQPNSTMPPYPLTDPAMIQVSPKSDLQDHPAAVHSQDVTHAGCDGGTLLTERGGQGLVDTHTTIADALTPLREFDQQRKVSQAGFVELAPQHLQTIDEIREQWRRRQSWHRAEKSLTLAAKAMCRRLVAKGEEKAELKEADSLYSAALGKGKHPLSEVAFGAIFPIVEARDGMEKYRKAVEKRLAKLAATLPVAPFIETLRGVGIGSLAAIVGEAGNLGNYANPAKLWKRMGLAVMPDGRQRKVAGAAAILHGYSPQRRSVMWNIGDCIVKAGGPLRELYDARKLTEHAKAKAEGLTVAPAGKIPKKDADKYRSEGHVHNRAKRYVEKRVLVLIWRGWRGAK